MIKPRGQGWRIGGLACLLLLAWLALFAPAQAQTTGGGIWTVDESGALVPGKRPTLVQGAPPTGPVNGVANPGVANPGVTNPGVTNPGVTNPGVTMPTGAKPGSARGASVPGAVDYAAWERMATRAETAIEDRSSTGVKLELLRAQLADWREALLGAQNANSARIATLRTQITALGPAPAEGEAEAEEIAKRRSTLTDQLVRLQAPGIAAEEAYRRADGLISEIDRVLRERQADEMLRLWPAPINPANWPEAAIAASNTAVTLWSEFAAKWADPSARREFGDNLPLILLYLAFAIAVLWRGRDWIDRIATRLHGQAGGRGNRIWGFAASLGLIIVPVLGVEALSSALQRTGMLGVLSTVIVQSMAGIGFTVFAAIWLGGRVFPRPEVSTAALPLTPERATVGRVLTSSFGLLLGIATLGRVAIDQLDLSEAATSVLTFPIIVVAGLLLLRMGQLMAAQARDGAVIDDGHSYRSRMMGILARAAMVIGVVGPALGAVGYISAASALVFPAALSLGLVGLLMVLQRLIADVHVLIMRSDAAEPDGLVPVLAGFALTLSTLPVFALIWGARWADMTEMWTRFREGFTLGETQVSPTDFLLFAIIFGAGYGATRLLQGVLKTSILPRTGLDQGGQNAIVSGLGYVGIFLAGLIAINSTGIDLSGLAIVAGALSVGIGFGLQNIVSNFVSGIILLIERPVSEGDWIEVAGVQGIVKSISVRSTRIQTFDRSDVIVPNTDLVAGRVTNWTRYNLSGRLIVPVTVPYTTDSRLVERILREIAEAQPLAVLNPRPLVVLMGFTGEAMTFEVRVILRDVNFSLPVRSEINHQIAERFAAAGIVFSNPHRDYLQKAADVAAGLAEIDENYRLHEAAIAAMWPDPNAGDNAAVPFRHRKPDRPTDLPEVPTS